MSHNDNKPLVPTIQRTFRILEALASAENGRGISELSAELGIAKSTTFNILMSLVQLGYSYRTEEDGKFHMSLKLFSLGSSIVERMDLRKVADSILHSLVEATGETANLGTIQGDEAIYIECLSGPHPVTVNTWPGMRLPLHCTALGKALLAWQPDDVVEAILAKSDMQVFTPNTVTSVERLLEELGEIRGQGYALDDEEDAPGMRCVGAPVFDYSGKAVAAISITAPVQRLPIADMPKTAAMVVASAREISQRLGNASKQGEQPPID
jgi:DNA-binding IclR family transcriptional regulator